MYNKSRATLLYRVNWPYSQPRSNLQASYLVGRRQGFRARIECLLCPLQDVSQEGISDMLAHVLMATNTSRSNYMTCVYACVYRD
jgi:hypothetical protein